MMTNGTVSLDDAYLSWLYGLVSSVTNTNPQSNHRELLKVLYRSAFDGSLPNDDNRAFEGKELRFEFLQTTSYPLDDPYGLWFDLDCSMLEMIIALSRRAALQDESGGSPVEWFWRILHNLEIDGHTDDIFEVSIMEEVEEIVDRVNNRTYSRNGEGGLFPLRRARQDQRKIELWAQMSAYLLEGTYADEKPRW